MVQHGDRNSEIKELRDPHTHGVGEVEDSNPCASKPYGVQTL